MKKLRPKILTDIRKKIDVFSAFSERVNFNPKKIFYFRFLVPRKLFIVFIAMFFCVIFFSSVLAPTKELKAEASISQQRVLEERLRQLEQEIVKLEGTTAKYDRQGRSLQNEVNQLNARIQKLNLQIRSVNLNLQKLDQEIDVTDKKITNTRAEIDSNKEIISKTLQEIYRQGNQNLLMVFLENPQLSDFFIDINNLNTFQSSVQVVLKKLVGLKEEYINQKEQFSLEHADAADLKRHQENQRQMVRQLQQDRRNLLTITKGREAEYRKLVTERRMTAAEIRRQIFRLLGGGQLRFGEAYELAIIAERATGVRAALILAVLDRESGLGRNVGQCHYRTAMHPRRDIPIFLEIIRELNLQEDLAAGRILVSCPIPRDGAFGGAMGPAQFIPSTWNSVKGEIAAITGNNPPSPWRNVDAFVATGLYLARNGAVPGASIERQREAASRYYAGRHWRRHLWTYGDWVIRRAARFEREIAILLEG